ncbi:MAG: LytR C-terminal domain-containing protein [Thermoleophilaceae bacterium]
MTIVQEIGAYAGFAAVVGLAVLAALYFSQARDVKRLREWAGRAPERAAEQEARIRAANQAPAAQPQPAQAAQAAQQRTAVAAQGGVPAVAPPPGGAPTAVQTPQSRPPVPTTSAFRPGPGPGTGPILGGARPDDPWYRRMHWPEPKYIALIVAGVLILGGGAAYGVKQLTSDSGGSAAPATSSNSGQTGGGTKKSGKRAGGQVNPANIRVSVLNGTSVTGQASKLADQLENKGYQRGTVANATGNQGQRAESVVEYSDGNQAAARAVGRELGITQVEKADPATQQLAGDAQVIVILGADKAAPTG